MIERLKETNSRRFRWLSASPIMAFRMTRGAGMGSRSGLMAGASKSIVQQNRTVSSPSPPGLRASRGGRNETCDLAKGHQGQGSNLSNGHHQ
jgi:hypothetical protein